MMIALALFQAAPLPPVLDAIGRQALPPSGCAAFLWQTGPTPRLVAMATPAALRLSIDGRPVTLMRSGSRGEAQLGLAPSTDFAAGDLRVTLELNVVVQPDLADGARVPAGTLQLTRGGGDAIVVPLAGMVGCAKIAR